MSSFTTHPPEPGADDPRAADRIALQKALERRSHAEEVHAFAQNEQLGRAPCGVEYDYTTLALRAATDELLAAERAVNDLLVRLREPSSGEPASKDSLAGWLAGTGGAS